MSRMTGGAQDFVPAGQGDEPLSTAESAAADEAEALGALGDVAGAIRVLERAIRDGARHPGFSHNLGNLLLREQQWDAAIEAFDRAIAGGYPSHLNRGFAQEMLGNLREAEADYVHALESKPDDVDALVNLGTLVLDDARVAEARVLLERAASIDSQAHWQLAGVFEAMDDQAAAVRHLNLAIEAGELRAHLDRARLGAHVAPIDEVSADFERAIAAGATSARSNYAVFLDLAGEPERGLDAALAGIAAGDDFCFAPAAVICESLGRLEEAAEYYRQAIAAGDEGYSDDLQGVLDVLAAGGWVPDEVVGAAESSGHNF